MSESFKFSKQARMSLRDRVANEIRRAVLSGQLKSGEALREQDIAQQMAVSRGPVREAFSRLEREGLLVARPYRDTVVSNLSTEELREVLLPIRWLLESYAWRKAIPQLTKRDFEFLNQVIVRMEVHASHDGIPELVEDDIEFHKFLIEMAGQSGLVNLWHAIDGRIRFHFALHGQVYADLHQIPKEHRVLLDSLRSKDPNEALKDLRIHVFDSDLRTGVTCEP